MLPPLLYLVHFFYVISHSQGPLTLNEKAEYRAHLPHAAQFYVDVKDAGRASEQCSVSTGISAMSYQMQTAEKP